MARTLFFKPFPPPSPKALHREPEEPPGPAPYSRQHVRSAADSHFDVRKTYPPEHTMRVKPGQDQNIPISAPNGDRDRGFLPKSPLPRRTFFRIPNRVLWVWFAVILLLAFHESKFARKALVVYLCLRLTQRVSLSWGSPFFAMVAFVLAAYTGYRCAIGEGWRPLFELGVVCLGAYMGYRVGFVKGPAHRWDQGYAIGRAMCTREVVKSDQARTFQQWMDERWTRGFFERVKKCIDDNR